MGKNKLRIFSTESFGIENDEVELDKNGLKKFLRNTITGFWLSATLLVAACASSPSAPIAGGLHSDVTWSDSGRLDLQTGTKVGRSCAESWFGIGTKGDARVLSAAYNGGITRVMAVDHTYKSWLFGLHAKYCTVVYGK